LVKSIKEALTKPGFCFVEIISQCPVSYGKNVGERMAADSLKHFKADSIPAAKAVQLTEEELEGKFVVGKLIERKREEFTVGLRRLHERFEEGA
jgi:2-oxoglutarate ferredoxin oxidoreductase subunit beta